MLTLWILPTACQQFVQGTLTTAVTLPCTCMASSPEDITAHHENQQVNHFSTHVIYGEKK